MPAIAEASHFPSEEIPRVVLISERPDVLAACTEQVTLAGFLVSTTGYGAGAMDMLRRDKPPLTVVDLSLPNTVGLEIMEAIQRELLGTAIIAVSRDGCLKLALKALQFGAFDYLPEPFDSDRLISAMCKALGRPAPTGSKRRSIEDVQNFLGLSPAMREVCGAIEEAGSTTGSVFITGQRGIGRDVCARAIHACGPRRHQPFVTVHCAALPKQLVESELFGHVAGAFPGAVTDRTALVTEAHGGTLFIDDICELDLQAQRKILWLARNGSFQRLGSNKVAQADLRIVCSTNRDPEREVAEGRLLGDLFDSLGAISIHLPPLGQRGTDVMLIARYFLFGEHPGENRVLRKTIPEGAPRNRSYAWPGGARDLQNALHDAIMQGDDRQRDAAPLANLADKADNNGQPDAAGPHAPGAEVAPRQATLKGGERKRRTRRSGG